MSWARALIGSQADKLDVRPAISGSILARLKSDDFFEHLGLSKHSAKLLFDSIHRQAKVEETKGKFQGLITEWSSEQVFITK